MNEQKVKKLLTLLVEEGAEITQEICKMLHHGVDNYNPITGVPNLEKMQVEIVDFLVILELLNKELHFDLAHWETLREEKLKKLAKWHPDLFT